MSKNTLSVPTRNAIPSKRRMVRCPVAAASGIVASRRARPTLLRIMIDRRLCLSTQTPATRLNNRKGAVTAAFRIPSCAGVPWRTSTAVNGIASSLNCAPKLEMVSEDQSLKKLGWRHKEDCFWTSFVLLLKSAFARYHHDLLGTIKLAVLTVRCAY